MHANLLVQWDFDAALSAEAVVWNKMIIERWKAGLITQEQAREQLGYPPSGGPAKPTAPAPGMEGRPPGPEGEPAQDRPGESPSEPAAG